MWKLLITGGYTMVPLFVCSVLALAIVIEKIIVLRSARVIPDALIKSIRGMRNPDIQGIVQFCDNHPTPFSRIVKAVLGNRQFSKVANQEQVQLEGKTQTNILERGLVMLEVIAAVAPLLGLLGTVLGLVDVFQVVSKLGVGQTEAFSSGIAKALITTVVGLIIAIPTLVAYSYFSKKVNGLVLIMEREATALLNKIYEGSL